MPESNTKSAARSRDSIANTMIVAISLSLVCSILVAGAAVMLKPIQGRNEELYRQRIILDVAGLYTHGANIDALFDNIETRMVDLASGEYTDAVSADGYDAIAAAKDTDLGIAIPGSADLANIHRRARYVPVYLVRDNNTVDQIILPVYGSGLWSTMQGFLSLATDGTTVRGLRFYAHAETPGLGDQIDKPDWRAQWVGKQIFNADGEAQIEVIRGFVAENSDAAIHQVDGLSGATLTGRGVTNLVRYWAGPNAFGPYLEKLHMKAGNND